MQAPLPAIGLGSLAEQRRVLSEEREELRKAPAPRFLRCPA